MLKQGGDMLIENRALDIKVKNSEEILRSEIHQDIVEIHKACGNILVEAVHSGEETKEVQNEKEAKNAYISLKAAHVIDLASKHNKRVRKIILNKLRHFIESQKE